jgi:CDP-glycerol glycerophosphotransferase (TagB/SpsB family)
MSYTGLNSFERRWLADLWSAHVVCIQHGLNMHSAPQYRARYIDNTEFYCCASSEEIEQLSDPSYAYESSMLRLTGLPRYDGLVSNTERLILLAPAWRGSAPADGRRIDAPNGYDPYFADTSYFAVYRAILRDEALLDLLGRAGYRLRFLLHPDFSAQAEDFADCANDYVEVISSVADGYERNLRRAAVLITDFSGIQYDWAYMEKPLIYFRPEELSPDREDEGADFEGFGPVARTAQELEIFLEGIIIGGAQAGSSPSLELTPTSIYRERMQDFFAHKGRENCARIYEELRREYV